MNESVPRMRDSLRRLPRPFWFLAAGMFVNRFGTFVQIFLILYVTNLGHSVVTAGAAVSLFSAGGLFASLAGGYMADRVGRRFTIILSMVVSAGVMLIFAQVKAIELVLILSFLAGLSTQLYKPASLVMVADLVPASDRLAAFGAIRFAGNLGSAAAGAVGGLLAQQSFEYLFIGDAATSLLFALIAIVALPKGRPLGRFHFVRGGFRAIRADRTLLIFLAAALIAELVDSQLNGPYPLQVIAYDHTYAFFGFMMALNSILIIVAELPLLAYVQRFPRLRVLAAGYVFQGLGVGLIVLSGGPAWLYMTVVLWTIGEMATVPIASALVADISPEGMRGRYQGAYDFTHYLANITAPLLGVVIFAWSPEVLWFGCLILALVAARLALAVRGQKLAKA